MLVVLAFAVACWPRKEEAKTPAPADEARTPLDPRLLDAPPQSQQNIGGAEVHDAIESEDALLEPLPPASPGSPYNSSAGPPPQEKK